MPAKIIHVCTFFIFSYSVAYLVGMKISEYLWQHNQFFQWQDCISGDKNMRLQRFNKVIIPVRKKVQPTDIKISCIRIQTWPFSIQVLAMLIWVFDLKSGAFKVD